MLELEVGFLRRRIFSPFVEALSVMFCVKIGLFKGFVYCEWPRQFARDLREETWYELEIPLSLTTASIHQYRELKFYDNDVDENATKQWYHLFIYLFITISGIQHMVKKKVGKPWG